MSGTGRSPTEIIDSGKQITGVLSYLFFNKECEGPMNCVKCI